MKKYFLLIIVIPFLISCDNNASDNKVKNDSDTSTNLVDEEATVSWPKTFSQKRIGKLNAGEDIQAAVKMLKEQFTVSRDSVPACFDCTEYETYYSVSEGSDNPIFSIHTTQQQPDKVAYIQVYDKAYKSPEGIHVGSTAKELKKAYNIKEAHFDFNNGLFLMASDFPGAFRIKCCKELEKTNYDFTRPTVADFPDDLEIEMIVIREK